MFGLRRIRRLESEIAVLTAGLDFYAINENWRRRSKHVKGRQWELSPAGKDHGARARGALLQAKALRQHPLTKFVDQLGKRWHDFRSTRQARRAIGNAAEYLKDGVRVPASLPPEEAIQGELT